MIREKGKKRRKVPVTQRSPGGETPPIKYKQESK